MPARRTTSATTFAPSSVAERGESPPMNFPTGVRTALKMTARSIMIAPSGVFDRKYKYKRRAQRGQFCRGIGDRRGRNCRFSTWCSLRQFSYDLGNVFPKDHLKEC